MSDPTHDEMLVHLERNFPLEMADEMDRECAIYWFANNYHSGQWSNLYSTLSMSKYHPGTLERQPRSVAKILYEELEIEFGK